MPNFRVCYLHHRRRSNLYVPSIQSAIPCMYEVPIADKLYMTRSWSLFRYIYSFLRFEGYHSPRIVLIRCCSHYKPLYAILVDELYNPFFYTIHFNEYFPCPHPHSLTDIKIGIHNLWNFLPFPFMIILNSLFSQCTCRKFSTHHRDHRCWHVNMKDANSPSSRILYCPYEI
ncbi:hypothetical protein V8G54_009483 [Vigna mungo]|uniref:Uncharacterized protein n=1 Tax=Vigna mungo TaxID=3915 RepID=A0AAQ3S5H7_VIGMU